MYVYHLEQKARRPADRRHALNGVASDSATTYSQHMEDLHRLAKGDFGKTVYNEKEKAPCVRL